MSILNELETLCPPGGYTFYRLFFRFFLVEIVIWITKIEDNGKGAKVTKHLDISIQKKKTDISMYYDVLQN